MFAESNPLIDFIEMQSDRCEGKVLTEGIIQLSIGLKKNLDKILDILISNDRMVPSSYLLIDLAEKIKKQNQDPQPQCVNSLEILYANCLPQLLVSCVYNTHDLYRCIDAMPTYAEAILKTLLFNEHQMQRISAASCTQNVQETLNEIMDKYPTYAEELMDSYRKNYEGNLGFH